MSRCEKRCCRSGIPGCPVWHLLLKSRRGGETYSVQHWHYTYWMIIVLTRSTACSQPINRYNPVGGAVLPLASVFTSNFSNRLFEKRCSCFWFNLLSFLEFGVVFWVLFYVWAMGIFGNWGRRDSREEGENRVGEQSAFVSWASIVGAACRAASIYIKLVHFLLSIFISNDPTYLCSNLEGSIYLSDRSAIFLFLPAPNEFLFSFPSPLTCISTSSLTCSIHVTVIYTKYIIEAKPI